MIAVSKRFLTVSYNKEQLGNLLDIDLSDADFKTIVNEWNNDIITSKTDKSEIDNFIVEWFTENFDLKITKKKE